jgi:hypothetical protein
VEIRAPLLTGLVNEYTTEIEHETESARPEKNH